MKLTDQEVSTIANALLDGAAFAAENTKPGAQFRGAYGAADDAGHVGGSEFLHKVRAAYVQGFLSECPRSVTLDPHGFVKMPTGRAVSRSRREVQPDTESLEDRGMSLGSYES